MSVPSAAASVRTRHARALFAGLPRTYDRMGRLLSFGQDPRWRRFMVSRVPSTAGLVLDVATGTGMVAREVAARTSGRVVGLDQSEAMLAGGVAETARAGMAQRIAFVLGQAERLPFPAGVFDAVTFTYLLRYVDDPAATVSELVRVLRPGGTLASLEFHVPRQPVSRSLWWVYTRAVMPVVGRTVSTAWYRVGRFLGPSISNFYRAHTLTDQLAMWRAAGVAHARARVMSLGGGVVVWGTKGTNGTKGTVGGR